MGKCFAAGEALVTIFTTLSLCVILSEECWKWVVWGMVAYFIVYTTIFSPSLCRTHDRCDIHKLTHKPTLTSTNRKGYTDWLTGNWNHMSFILKLKKKICFFFLASFCTVDKRQARICHFLSLWMHKWINGTIAITFKISKHVSKIYL